jgi:hypothetical protein
MGGPKRGMELVDTSIVEYDVRIKTGKQEKDDVQLIDGVTILDDKDTEDCHVFIARISGECGIIDMTVSRLNFAVEATIEVLISEVYSNFYLCVGCFTSGLREETQLFDGVIGKPQNLKRSVVAVRIDTNLDLKLKVGSESFISAEHLCSFIANEYGYVSQEIKTGPALFSVKVTWSTMPPSVDAVMRKVDHSASG